MVELVGDPCIPSELVVPIVSGVVSEQPTKSGAVFISGALLYVVTGGIANVVGDQAG